MSSKVKTDEHGFAQSFVVTCVVGEVQLTKGSGISPVEAAFRLIAQHDAPGEYRFPHEAGGEYVVEVRIED